MFKRKIRAEVQHKPGDKEEVEFDENCETARDASKPEIEKQPRGIRRTGSS